MHIAYCDVCAEAAPYPVPAILSQPNGGTAINPLWESVPLFGCPFSVEKCIMMMSEAVVSYASLGGRVALVVLRSLGFTCLWVLQAGLSWHML